MCDGCAEEKKKCGKTKAEAENNEKNLMYIRRALYEINENTYVANVIDA